MKRLAALLVCVAGLESNLRSENLDRIGLFVGGPPIPRVAVPTPKDPTHFGGIAWQQDHFVYIPWKILNSKSPKANSADLSQNVEALRDPFRVMEGKIVNLTRTLQRFEAGHDIQVDGWTKIRGTVLQNLKGDGLLIAMGDTVVRVSGYGSSGSFVDGASFDAVVKASGIFRYTDLQGAVRTVKSFQYGAIPNAEQWAAIRKSIPAK